jgi:L-ribulose-5-phosphate 3-epimerase
MNSPIVRRKFIQTVGLGALGGAALVFSKKNAESQTPMPSAQTPRFFAGCCAYSFSKHLESKQMTMEDFIVKGVDLGVHGVDITVYWLKSTEPAYLASLRHLAFKNGMPFSGAACGPDMLQADKTKRLEVLAEIKKWVDATDMLGASHLRVFAGQLPKGASEAQGVDWTIEVMKPACDYAARGGVTLGVETHSGISQRAGPTLEIIRRVDSPYAGINLDISNFIAGSDEDQYKQIEACVPYATHTHIRDRFGESHHPIDLDRVWKLFATGGYKGYMSVEYEGEEDAMTGVPRLVDRVKALCKKYSSA